MTKPIPRSRLHITYRTKIDGTPKKAKLPMRFLVLGDFSAHDQRRLDQREVHSVLPGMQLDSFMKEMAVSAPIEHPLLRETLYGGLVGEVTAKITASPGPEDETAKFKLMGTARVSGDMEDNGLGSFTGEVEVSGEVELPIKKGKPSVVIPDEGVERKVMLYGKVEPKQGTEIGVNGVTGNIEASVAVKFGPNIAGDLETSIDLRSEVKANSVPVALTIPLRKISHFKPQHLVESVPELRRLALLRSLVLETRNYISSYPELREVVKGELGKENLAVLSDQLRELYPQMLVEPPRAAAQKTEEQAAN